MKTRPTVWVVKEQIRQSSVGSTPMDYTPAYELGDVKFITEFDLPIHPNSSIAQQWYQAVMRFAQEFDPTNDFVVLTGQPAAIFVIGMIMGHLNIVPKILVWKREQGRYVSFQPSPHGE